MCQNSGLKGFPLILASASPRRKEILSQMGFDFQVIPAAINEVQFPKEKPVDYVCRMAQEKCESVAKKHSQSIILAADTIVILNDEILGKPAHKPEAIAMLQELSGKTHQVITAFAINAPFLESIITQHEITDVTFRELTSEEIRAYAQSGSPMDKAGAYGIQDLPFALVEKINGCYFNVMGFPATKFYKCWQKISLSPTK
jgi:septum formation protein